MSKYVGAHVSIEGGVFNAPKNAVNIGAKAFAMFSKNQRQWFAKPLSDQDADQFKIELKKSGILPSHVLVHDSYLINLGHPEEEAREKSLSSFAEEVKRCMQLGLDKINFHPGYHLKKITEKACLNRIAESMNEVLKKTEGIALIIENTAGQGSSVGYTFEHLAYLISKIKDPSRVGVCIDTCHMFAAGYDIRTKKTYEETWKEFDRIVGFNYLKGMHMNDSKSEFGSHVDRHHSIGKGHIGFLAFEMIMNDSRMDDIPLILETIDPDLWKKEVELLYGFMP